MKTAKIKNWINCNIKREHIYDLGTNPERWEAECERQLKTVGYIECRCMYCGRLLIGITRRNVTDYSMCDSVADDNCLRVLIDGYESGAYWMTSEADTLPSIKFATIAEDEEENEQGINLLIEEDANG